MPHALLVALGGAAGALARWGVGRAAVALGLADFPWGTWVVNLVGCLLIGLAFPWVAAGHARLGAFAVVGFLGAFTTFSAYSLETVMLLQNGRAGAALLNALGPVVLGLVCVGLGLYLARLFGAPAL